MYTKKRRKGNEKGKKRREKKESQIEERCKNEEKKVKVSQYLFFTNG